MKKKICLIIFSLACNLSYSQVNFRDMSSSSGIISAGRSHGVAFADFDNDGDEDIYVLKRSKPNILFRNNGDMTFTDVAKDAGVDYSGLTYTAVWGDMDNDGFPDLYLGNTNTSNKFYHNNGDGTFTDLTSQSGLGNTSTPNSIALADIDNDGFLDIYLGQANQSNVLYHNNGDLTFTNIINEAGADDPLFSMGSIFFDFDNDNDPDLYLVHDSDEPNILLENDGTGHFSDVSAQAGVAWAGQGMGVDFGDYNNDGYFDLYITNLFENVLYLNNGDGTFTNVSTQAKVDDYGMGWSTAWLDYDCDGLQDIYVANESHFTPYPNVLYRNLGDGTFNIVSKGTPLESNYSGFGMATADLNNDGGPDIFVANDNDYENDELFISDQISNNWIKIKCVGVQSNKSGIGTRVEIQTTQGKQVDMVTGGSGYCSQNSLTLQFGIGSASQIDLLKITWPDGAIDTYTQVEPNGYYVVTEGESKYLVTGIQNAIPETNYSIYPNPFSSILNLSFPEGTLPSVVSILNSDGKRVYTSVFNARESQIDLSSLPSGLYIVSIQNNSGSTLRKIVKNN